MDAWDVGVGFIGTDVGPDLFESVGEIGGDPMGREDNEWSDGALIVDVGRCASEMLANKDWNEALAYGK